MRFNVLYNFNLLVLLQLAQCDCGKWGLTSTDSPRISAEALPQHCLKPRPLLSTLVYYRGTQKKNKTEKQETINLHAMLLLPFSPFWPFCPGFPWGKIEKENKQTKLKNTLKILTIHNACFKWRQNITE